MHEFARQRNTLLVVEHEESDYSRGRSIVLDLGRGPASVRELVFSGGARGVA